MSNPAGRVQVSSLPDSEQALIGTEEGYQTLIQRARDILPLVASRASDAETLGQVPRDVIDALRASGLLKMLRPARFGGYAQRPELLLDVGSIIGRGCTSTSWVLVNLAIHDLYVANWPREAQEEVWRTDADVLIGSSFVFPAGRARRVKGGYVVSGRWPFSSGVHPCEWNILGGIVQPEGDAGTPHQRYFLLKREQYSILDTWHVAALRGTGSADVEVRNAFVPDHLTLDYIELLGGCAPGASIHDDPLVSFPFAASGGFILLCPLYGAVRGALDAFVENARGAVARSSGKSLVAEPTYQSKLAEVGALIDAVELITREAFRSLQKDVVAGEKFTGKNALKLRRDSAFCAKLCVRAADILFALGGGSALFERNPLQRVWRDVHGGSAHIVFQWDVHGVAFGRVELGLPSGLPGMQV
jgi:3-hydroxy-9,10-secoandrosta-1,3,5(10)-triene-9,17-dione monooxygenase